MHKIKISDSLTRTQDVMDSIEDYDVFNSSFIHALDKSKNFQVNIVTKFEKRLDLIARELNGTTDNYGLLGIFNRIQSDDDLSAYSFIKYLNEDEITNVMSESINVVSE